MLLTWVIIISVLICLSFIGWGELFSNNQEKKDFGVKASYGMAWACILGGVLNGFELISKQTIIIFITTGLVLWVYQLVIKKKSDFSSINYSLNQFKRHKLAAFIFFVFLLLNLTYGALPSQNEHDDNHAYLVFPQQMLATGEIGDNPFNERRLGVLGGQSFLNATMLTFVSYQQMGAMDKIVGWLVFVLLIFTHGFRAKLTGISLLLLLSIWHWRIPLQVNHSSLITALALFYALLRRFQNPEVHHQLTEVLKTALLIAALISLKATNIVGIAFLLTFLLVFERRLPLSMTLKQLSNITIFSLIFILPWMLASYHSNQTLLFPIFGQGTHTSWEQGAAILSIRIEDINWDYLKLISVKLIYDPVWVSGVFFLAVGLLGNKSFFRNTQSIAIPSLIAAILASISLTFVSLGMSRYSYPFLFASFAFIIIEFLSIQSKLKQSQSTQKNWLISNYWLAWLTITFYVGTIWPGTPNRIENKITAIHNFSETDLKPFPQMFLTQAQHAIPPKQTVLAILSHPYLMDFARNPVFVIDHAGSTSPAPGLPLDADHQAISNYLIEQGIEYLIYSHYDQGGYAYNKYKHRLKLNGSAYADRIRILTKNNFKLRKSLQNLAMQQQVIYLDELFMVIRLHKSSS